MRPASGNRSAWIGVLSRMPAMRDFRNEFATHSVAHALPRRAVAPGDTREALAELLALLAGERRGDALLGSAESA